MRCSSVVAVSFTLLAIGACGGESLSTRAGGTGGATPPGTGGTGGVLSSGGSGAGGMVSTGTGGTSLVPSSGGTGGAAGAFSTGAGGTDAALAGGAEVAPATGGAAGTDAALSSGGTSGTVDVREADSVADSTGEAGGSSVGKNILDLVPLDNTVSGWKVDQAVSRNPGQRAMTATTQEGVENLIDGGADPFFMSPYKPKIFAWQNYVNLTLPAAPDGANVTLYILQMSSPEQAAGLYKAVLGAPEYSRQAGTPDDWQDPTTPRLGTDSRIEDTYSQWWINFYKDVFYVEVMLNPSYGPAPDYNPGSPVLKAEALRFAQAVASQI